jgi:hypothetical protein
VDVFPAEDWHAPAMSGAADRPPREGPSVLDLFTYFNGLDVAFWPKLNHG